MSTLPTGTVTFLFTDIEGSTILAQQYRVQWENLHARHHAILHQVMQIHDGHVFQIIGDTFCVAFHTAMDAINAAVDAQKLLYQEAWDPAPIKVCMSIHSGTALTLDRGDGIYLVNVDIAPGVWRSTGTGTSCYWQTSTKTGDIIDNHFGLSGGTAYIPPSAFSVTFEDCGIWTYLGPP